MRGQGRETWEKGAARTKAQSPPTAGTHLAYEDGGCLGPSEGLFPFSSRVAER